MKLTRSRPFLVFWLLVLTGYRLHGAQGEGSGAAATSIKIDASRAAAWKIPRSIFGTFLEPIGNSTYGGLWAEILQNPSFEGGLWSAHRVAEMIRDEPLLSRSSEMALPLPWEPLDYAQGARYAPEWNDAANSYRSLMIMALPDKQTGIRQKVYLPIQRVLHYQGSLYIKHLSGPSEAEVSLRERDHADKILASRKLALTENDWRRYEFNFELAPDQLRPLQAADFVIAVSHETRVLVDQVSLMPGDALDGMDPDMMSMARALKTSIVRFGGNFTSAYHWRDGVGPRDKRVSMLNIAWGIPEYNQFGTDEFLRFCQRINAQPQIALNLGTGTPDEAAAWVQYVDAHWGDHSGGLLWELGNELWGNFQVGYPTLSKVAERTQAFSAAVKKVDPHARLIATGGDPDSFEAWNAAQLSTETNTFDYLSTHFVVTTGATAAQNPSPELVARATFALPVELERRLRKMHQQIQNSPSHKSVKTAFTEWLFYAPDDTYPRYDNTGGAVAAAGFLNMLLRNADIVPVSDMTGLVEFGGIWKKRGKVFGVPAYWVFKMYSTADVSRPVAVRTDGESYNVEQGSNRLPTIADVPYLDVVATLNESGATLTLFCVNRDLTRDIPATIQIAGFRPGSVAHASSLYAASIYEKNDETEPEHIHPEESSFPVLSPEFKYTFRPASLTVITLTR
jgi:alpha-N-arabinofuranosidase